MMSYKLTSGILTRFLFQKNGRYNTSGKVLYGSFMPPIDKNNPPIDNNKPNRLPDLSVCVISSSDGSKLGEAQIWKIGCVIESISNYDGDLKARADINIEYVNDVSLIVEVNGIPIDEHANIKPFPKQFLECQKKATYLANNSQLEILDKDK